MERVELLELVLEDFCGSQLMCFASNCSGGACTSALGLEITQNRGASLERKWKTMGLHSLAALKGTLRRQAAC